DPRRGPGDSCRERSDGAGRAEPADRKGLGRVPKIAVGSGDDTEESMERTWVFGNRAARCDLANVAAVFGEPDIAIGPRGNSVRRVGDAGSEDRRHASGR